MKTIYTLALSLFATASLQAQNVTLTKKWETEATLKVPESVIYDEANKVLYAANIDGKPWEKDGVGSIAKIALDGKVLEVEWVKGLNAPKGLGIFKGKLYVADITNVVVIDIAKGQIEKTIAVPNAVNLNDVTIDKKGNVYVSDSGDKKIYLLSGDLATVWHSDDKLINPNGVLALSEKLIFIDMKVGNLYEIPTKDKAAKKIAENVTSGDGIVEIAKDEYLVSNWNGEINYVHNGLVEKLLDTKEAKISAADIWYIPSEKLVLVPTFFTNTVAAYSLKK